MIERNKRLKRIDDLKIKIMILKNESAVCYAKGQNDLYELKKAELDNLNAELNLLEFIHNHDSFQNVNPEPEEKPGTPGHASALGHIGTPGHTSAQKRAPTGILSPAG
ncbi:MAG: hypothetical protein IJL01_06345, partial [Synergistaceae bacterium]|nr:hypothetical protein [Synergistaceae bacterium]